VRDEDGHENMILCAGCDVPYCGPCVRAGLFVHRTGRVIFQSGKSPTEAFCDSCREERKAKKAAAARAAAGSTR
jgi:hypothetical protein